MSKVEISKVAFFRSGVEFTLSLMECGHVRSCRQKRPWCWPYYTIHMIYIYYTYTILYYTIHMMAIVLTCLCQRVQLLYLSASIFLFYLHNVFIWALRRTILLAKHIFQWHLVQFTNTIEILLNTEHNRRLSDHITGEGGWTDHNSDQKATIFS